MSIEPGTLYLVSTPIGHLEDLTFRAARILNEVSVIACEDTRHSLTLLKRYAVRTLRVSLHEHNEAQESEKLISRMLAGESVALISDAGTPLISDPGQLLVRKASQAGIQVVPIPGASAMLAALCASALPTGRFIFEGFLPSKAVARRELLGTLAQDERTLIFFESSHRIVDCLKDMSHIFGTQRRAVVARELTKLHETVQRDSLGGLLNWIEQDENQQRGEFVLLIEGITQASEIDVEELTRVLQLLMEELPLKSAVRLAAGITGVNKNVVYQHALSLAQEQEGAE